jgi:hypothetical protein
MWMSSPVLRGKEAEYCSSANDHYGARIANASGPAPRSPKNASINGGPRKPRLLTAAVVAWAPAVERSRAATTREVPITNAKMIAPRTS